MMRADQLAEATSLIALGQDLEDEGRLHDALRSYLRAVELAPAHSPGWINAGIAQAALGHLTDAHGSFAAAIALDDHPAAHLNLANLLLDQQDYGAAERHYAAALDRRPGWREARFGLLCVRFEAKQADARASVEAFLLDYPDDLPARLMLADLLLPTEGADVVLRMLEALRSDSADVRIKRAKCQSLLFEHHQAHTEVHQALRLEPSTSHLMAFAFGSMADPEADYLRLPLEIAGALASMPAPAPRTVKQPRRHGRIRIGYLSGDFRAHPVANFLYPVLKSHDRSRFEVYALSNTATPDLITDQLRNVCDHWLDLAKLDDDQAATLVADAELDAVIDFSGWTERHRIDLLRRRLAPVQATAFAVYLTTGIPEVDFRICDDYSDPVGMTEAAHSERLLRMGGPQACYHEFRAIPHQTQQPFESRGYFTYGFFNQATKISLPMLEAWSKILHRCPDSRLHVVGVDNPGSRRRLLEYLLTSGIQQSRVEVEGRLPASQYAQRLGAVDLALDGFPWNGGTTTIETLLAGVPVLSLSGQRPSARCSRVFLDPIGLASWAHEDLGSWIEAAVRVATSERSTLRPLRLELPERVRSSSLMDPQDYIVRWESALTRMLETVSR